MHLNFSPNSPRHYWTDNNRKLIAKHLYFELIDLLRIYYSYIWFIGDLSMYLVLLIIEPSATINILNYTKLWFHHDL